MNVPKIRFNDFDDNIIKISIKELGNVITGTTPSTTDRSNYGDEYLWASPVDMGDFKYINNTKTKLSEKGFNKTRCVPKDSILITCIGSTIGKTGMASKEMSTNQQINTLIPNKIYNSDYLYYCINFNFPRFLNKISFQAVPIISKSVFEKLEVSITKNIYEQEKIGKLLSLLDKKIELQSKKIEDLKLFKLYTKNQLFRSGEKVVKLKDILNKWNEKNKDGSIKYVESISNKYGFISQSDQFEDRNIASKDLKNYYVIRKNVFGYNPSRLNVGSLALKENDNTSVVSPLYECFTTTQNNKFMLEWFDSKYFKKGTLSKFEGGVRNTLNFTNLCEIEINLPTLDKQNEFANYLYNFDKKIQLEELKLNKLNEMKKGLMQNMFV